MRPAATVMLVVGAVLAGLASLCGAEPGGATPDRVLAVMDLAEALDTPGLADVPGLVLSPRDLVVVIESGTGVEGARALDGAGRARLVGRVPARPLWIADGSLDEDLARELGLTIVYAAGRSTLFEADRNDAYRLLERGYFIVQAGFRPLRDLARPDIGPALADRLLRDRPLSEERVRFLRSLVGSVDTARIDAAVRFLAYDEADSVYRSRFAPRRDVREEITPYIYNSLASYVVPEGGAVTQAWFEAELPDKYKGEDSVFINVVARRPGRRTSAHFIVCAHYDATASRESAWLEAGAWKTLPAPGANDNATGSAALFEVARLIAPLELDVGVTFVAFSGEELGLLGSLDFAGNLGSADSVLGVINMDMLGYAEDVKTVALVYDGQSRWLSDLLVGAASDLGLDIDVRTRDGTGTYSSDHAAFWQVGVPGVMMADEQDDRGIPTYPHYHTVEDTPDRVDLGQVCDNARLVVGLLGRFAEVQADTLSDLTLSAGSIEWKWEGKEYLPMMAGEPLELVVRAPNLRGSMLEPADYRFEVRRGDSTGRVVFADTVALEVLAGAYAEVEGSWTTDAAEFGSLAFTVTLAPLAGGIESDLADNWIETRLDVMPGSTVISNLHVYPNPAGDPASANLSFEIWHPKTDFAGRMEIWVYDLEGERVGHAALQRTHIGIKEIAIGANTVPLSELLDRTDLAPGLYVCLAELTVTGQSGSATAKSKFAVAR
ncbi:MAG: M28 family metallopeptidase [bacterium]